MKRLLLHALAAVLPMTFLVDHVAAQVSVDRRVDLALSLIPATARGDATVLLRSVEGDETFREGTGPFVCLSDVSRAGRISLNCHHRTLDGQLRVETELSAAGIRGAEFRRQLCQELESRSIVVPNGAMEITASVQYEADGSLAPEMTVYSLLYVPGATKESIGVTDQNPGQGMPYLHHPGGCGAHVMWSETRRVGPGH